LLGFSSRSRDNLIVFGPSFIDETVSLLLGLVDLIPGWFYRIGRIDILKDYLINSNAGLVLPAQFLQLRLDIDFDCLPPYCQYLSYGPVPYHLSHNRFIDVAKGLGNFPHLK
jgi:hypothetical protein